MAAWKCVSLRPMLFTRVFQQRPAAGRSGREFMLPLARAASSSSSIAARCESSMCVASSSLSRSSIEAVADTAAEGFGQLGVDHLGQAAEFLLDRLGLADQHPEDPVFGSLPVDEVVTEDLGFGLQLAVDSAVALFHAAGIPGHVEMEQVVAVNCRFRPSRAASVAIRMRTGCLRGSALNACLISSRPAGGVGPWKTCDATIGPVAAGDRRFQPAAR
jgi:hypothetical protein